MKSRAVIGSIVFLWIPDASVADPVGLWQDKDGGTVRIHHCGHALCGTTASVNPAIDPTTGKRQTDKNNADSGIRAAETFDVEYAVLLRFLLYTGVRIGEALALTWNDVRLDERRAWVRTSKNGDPRELVLREDLCALLRARQKDAGRVFGFRQGGWLKWKLLTARMLACGLAVPVRPKRGKRRVVAPHRLSWVNHHSFCHTWATWMRRYGGLDEIGLAATKRWKDPRSAKRYAHAVAREEWNRVEALPAVENPWKRASGGDK